MDIAMQLLDKKSTLFIYNNEIINNDFSRRLSNRLIANGLEPVLSHTEKSCIALYCRQFSTNNKNKIDNSFVIRAFGPSGTTKLDLILEVFILLSTKSCL